MRTLVDSGCPTARLRMTSTLTNAGAGAAIAWRLLPQPQTVGTGNVFRTTNARNGQQYVARLTVAAGICANPRNINDTITITCVANATHEIDGLQRFDVYPNPAKDGNFNVNLMLQEMQTVGVSVFNTLGQKVWFNAPTPQVGSIEIPVQLPQVAKGLYLVEINANGKIATQRILIE
jgi:hypothetical protein